MAFLCNLRKIISGYNRYIIASLSYFGLLLLFIFISELSYQLVIYMDMQQLLAIENSLSYHFKNLIIGGIISGIVLRYFYIQHQWKLQTQAKAQTKLQLLQARIRPHFLFNSMNTIASLTQSNPQLAEQVTINLADLFRILFQEKQGLVSWKKEQQIAKQYLEIESLRFSQRLQILWSIDNMPDNALLPILTLQPLLENAIYHGIEPSISGGKIHILAQKRSQKIVICISNSPTSSIKKNEGNHMAVENIRQRLNAYFGSDASLRLLEQNNEFNVTLIFPYQTNL
jgi:two-component system sensor histidine kinase AlgZ